MSDIGYYLKELRDKRGYSLNDVCVKTGITNSKLSKIERGVTQTPDPKVIKQLACLYGIPTVSLFQMAGYLDENDLLEYTHTFKGVDRLKDNEKETIQQFITLLIKREEG